MQIVADRGSVKAKSTVARDCNIAIYGASEDEAATGYVDVPFDLARARQYAILPCRDGYITAEDAVVIAVAALPRGESDGNDKAADGIAERQRLHDRGRGVNAADHPAEFRAQKPARSLRQARVGLGDRADQRAAVIRRIGSVIGVEHGHQACIVATAADHRLRDAVKRAPDHRASAVIDERPAIGAPRLRDRIGRAVERAADHVAEAVARRRTDVAISVGG